MLINAYFFRSSESIVCNLKAKALIDKLTMSNAFNAHQNDKMDTDHSSLKVHPLTLYDYKVKEIQSKATTAESFPTYCIQANKM